jgi:signal transduction histidine kinase/ActR/RegA family two-component response regulator
MDRSGTPNQMPIALKWLTNGWTLSLIFCLVVLGLVHTVQGVLQIERDLVESLAIEDAARYSDTLREFRTLYTSEVVERAVANGTRITHDYQNDPGALPLPSTLSMLLGKRLTSRHGGDVRLYSDTPFPWRVRNRKPLDSFQSMALEALRDEPSNPVLRFEESDGVTVVRYATADLMRESCVECHNTHPDSPKRDWVVGDVRGVLEVSRPVTSSWSSMRLDIRNSLRTVVLVSALGLLGLGVMVTILRRLAQYNQELAERTVESNRQLATEIKQRQFAEEQAINSQKLESLGLLAGGIAHDFNNLLVSILGHLELARLPHNTPAAKERHLSLVQKGAERAKNLIKQMLTYVGKQPIEQQAIDLTHRIEQITPLFIARTRRNANLVFETESNLPTFLGDPGQIEQVYVNLITNASEAIGDQPGTITVRTGMAEDTEEVERFVADSANPYGGDKSVARVFLEVEDTGCGLSPEARKRMMDPFFSTKGPGRGLGLASIQGIARAHHATIMIGSTENVGTLFRIEFPVAGTTELQPADTTIGEMVLQGDGRTVLVVDDDNDARETTTELLKANGFHVLSVESGSAAIERCRIEGATIDAIVLDMSMPAMSGVDTYRHIMEIQPDILVVFISGFFADEDTRELLHSGKAVFVQKPFSADQLMRAVLLEKSKPDGSLT